MKIATCKSFVLILVLFFIHFHSAKAQNVIRAPKGYAPHIGVVISMLDDLKRRVTGSVENLTQEQADFLLDKNANSVGAMILHLAATEKYYQVYTFENRGYNKEESAFWDPAMDLGDKGRKELVGKPISYYLGKWDEVRAETKRLLKTKDDKWFDKRVDGSSMNNHWAWYHVMEHEANHMGQIRLIIKRM